ncbi:MULTISPECIES: hypothetical protein [Moorena]|uniref:hypothetical protein n=1 Tax=Moorena TaxID=1155738 RepID=UPI0012B5D4E9|nr:MULTISPECIES: hypothetical protein [Moorena]NER91168.1 hypothetical protein [Moorena sp. SIO3A2]
MDNFKVIWSLRESGVGSGATRGEFNSPTESAPRESGAVRPVANLIRLRKAHRGSRE